MPADIDGHPGRASRTPKRAAPATMHTSLESRAMPRGSKKASGLAWEEAPPALPMDAALKEITMTPAAVLHRVAAHAWAARALACYRVCLGKVDLQEGLSYLYLGEHYREAALAHASFGEAWRPLLAEVEAVMDADRDEASAAMRRRSLGNPGIAA